MTKQIPVEEMDWEERLIELYTHSSNYEDVVDFVKEIRTEAISTAVKEANSDLRGEINNNFWNKIIPQAKQDILDDFCIFLEKEGLTVLVDKLNDNKKYGGVEFYKEKFMNKFIQPK